MEELFIYRGAQKLRCGFTTGSCAAAAAKAAAQMLLTRKIVGSVRIITPKGIPLDITVCDQEISRNSASCAVIKQSGDDPDVTAGIKICACVAKIPKDIIITGGKGIGKVTKSGLDQKPGNYAINSVPRQMIADSLSDIARIFDYSGGFHVTVSAPEGEEIARKTFNPRMGIVGGISIIGTTGIVEPMSSSALVDTIRAEANMRRAAGHRFLLLTVGNFSEDFLRLRNESLSQRCVTCSNFIGDAIDIGVSLGFDGILLIGHIGKLVKLGSGIMNTHSAYADGRMETLITCGALAGVPAEILREIDQCVTTDAALEILGNTGFEEAVFCELSSRISRYMSARAKGLVKTGALVFGKNNRVLFQTGDAETLIKNIEEE